jgi:2'-5' RNA ligase
LKKKGTDKKTLRAFIAAPVPESVSEHLRKIQVRLKTSGIAWRWVKPETIHLTLKFFGEIDPEQIQRITALMDQTA